VEIETQFEKDEEILRKRFADCCLGDAGFFEWPGASNCLNLGVIADPSFGVGGLGNAALIGLDFKLPQMQGPSFIVKSRNVIETLGINELKTKLQADQISRVVFKFTFSDDKRGKRVTLSGANTISFKRATHAEEVFESLRTWKILVEGKPASESADAAGHD
jgi:hypothetical protein